MKKGFSFKTIFSFLMAMWVIQSASIGHAQTASAESCDDAKADFVSAMEAFRAAYFMREDAVGTAESVMENQVSPSADQMSELCPPEIAGAVQAGVERSKASLDDPGRWQLVACDQALVSYQSSLGRYDSQNLGGYNDYRNVLYGDIDPAAKAAVEACPQMPDLAEQTQAAFIERQVRLDRMEDIDNQGPSYFDTRGRMEDYNDAYDALTD